MHSKPAACFSSTVVVKRMNMSRIRCIIPMLLVHVGLTLSKYTRENFLKDEVSLWCDKHPFAKIYTDGVQYNCDHKVEDWIDFRIKTIRMDEIRLRVGLFSEKLGYDYDCGGYLERNHRLRPKPSYSYYILQLLQDILQFQAEFVMTHTWGVYDEKRRNWTGLVGLAKERLIDLGICHTTVTEEREDVVDFLLPTLISTRSFVYNTKKLPLTKDVFVLTFSPMLWLSFFASTILLVLCFRISTWAHTKLRPDHEPWSWAELILWANAAVCQQSYSRHPRGSSCRTTFLIGYIITYLLYTGFAAGVTSLLAVEGRDSHLGFKDVILLKLNLIVQSDGTQLDFLKNSPDPYAKRAYLNYHDQIEKNRVESLKDLFAKIDMENSIGLGTSVTVFDYLKRNIPEKSKDFTVSQIANSMHQKAFVLPKKSPYKEAFNYWLLRLMEAGLLDFGISKYVRTNDPENWHQNPGWSSAGLGNVLSAVIIFGGGWFFSVLILFGEIIWKKNTISSDWEIISRRDIQAQLFRNIK